MLFGPGSCPGSNLKCPCKVKLALALTDPDIVTLPDSVVLPSKVLLPI